MIENALVSIIIPCYNGEKTLTRCLKSLLEQTYRNLEIILVNDGSTDNSEEIVLGYKKRFEAEGMIFRYIKQKNTGLGGAINVALKVFSGDYLCWGDCDDFFMPESVERRYRFLKEHPEFGSVSSDAYVYSELDLEHPVELASKSALDLDNPNQFMNHLNGIPLFVSGCHMLCSNAFLDVNPTRSIYPARHGQNAQLLMPIYYKYKHAFLPEPLYGYVVYSNSMSHQKLTLEEERMRRLEYSEILRHTVEQIAMPNKEKRGYLNIVKGRRYRGELYYALGKHSYFGVVVNTIRLFAVGQLTCADRKYLQEIIVNKIRRFSK